MGFEAFLEGWGDQFYDHSGNGAVAGIYIFPGSSCDELSGFADSESLQGGPSAADVEITNLHIKVSSGDLGVAVSNDGGVMNLLNLFVYVDDSGSIDLPDLVSKGNVGIQIKESIPNGMYDSSEIIWSEVPKNPAATEKYEESSDNGLLYYGPKLTHKNFFLKDNSASKRTYDDVDIFLQAENKREITVKTLSGISHTTGSFELALSSADEINISSFNSELDYNNPVKLTGSLQAWSFEYSSSTDIVGLSEIGRIKFSEDVLGDHMLDSDPNVEVVYPPIGKNKTLVSPKVKEGYIYPTWQDCIMHSDTSDSNFLQLNSSNEIISLSNAFSTGSFGQDGSYNVPVLNNQNDFGNSYNSAYFTNGKKLIHEQGFDFNSNQGMTLLFNCNVDYKSLNDRLMAADPPWNANILDNRTSIANFYLESSDLVNTTFTSSIYFSEEDQNRIQYDYLIENLSGSHPNFLEEFFISGSIFALKESYDEDGNLVKGILTEVDVNGDFSITEDTKYFFNSYGDWQPDNLNPDGNEGFYSFGDLASSSGPLTGAFPYWHFTVSEEGSLLFHSGSDDVDDITTFEDSIISQVAHVLISGSQAEVPENQYGIATNLISYFWNDSSRDHIRLKDSDTGQFVYIKDANDKISYGSTIV